MNILLAIMGFSLGMIIYSLSRLAVKSYLEYRMKKRVKILTAQLKLLNGLAAQMARQLAVKEAVKVSIEQSIDIDSCLN